MGIHTPDQIVTDAEIERVHAKANFGSQTKRGVVNEGVLKAAFGYASGHTQMSILHEHGLIHQFRSTKRGAGKLTVKGTKYLRAVYGPHFSEMTKLGMV